MVRSRRLGKTGRDVSELGFGAWAIGGSWGETDDSTSLAAMNAAVDAGVTFFDTADAYGDGASEDYLGEALGSRRDEVIIATKFGSEMGADPSRIRWTRTIGEDVCGSGRPGP